MSLVPRDYQSKCNEQIKLLRSQGYNRQIISLPTGSGKTVVFSHLIKDLQCKSLVFCPRTELLQQAQNKIKMIAPELRTGIVNGESKEFDAPVVLSSIQAAFTPKTLEALKEQNFDLLIFDEAHHSAADGSRKVLEELGFGKGTKKLLVGFTATPFRNDERGLGEVFDVVAFKLSIRELIKDGYLCAPIGKKIALNIDLAKVNVNGGDFVATSLSEVMDCVEIADVIVKSYAENAKERPAICFCASVRHAFNMADRFRANGIAAKAISGETPTKEREYILQEYRSGKVKVLCNCMILTEGFDAPETSCIIVGRPTKSRGLYQQMIGRGLRLWPNKRDCLVFDINEKTHSICTLKVVLPHDGPPSLKYTPPNIQYDGNAPAIEKVDEIPVQLNQRLKSAILNHDLFGENFTWEKDHEGIYRLKGNSDLQIGVVPENEGDLYSVLMKKELTTTCIGQSLSFEYAFNCAEEYARKHRKDFILSDKEAPWRELPISEKQKDILKKGGYRAGIDNLTRGQASSIIQSGVLRRK